MDPETRQPRKHHVRPFTHPLPRQQGQAGALAAQLVGVAAVIGVIATVVGILLALPRRVYERRAR